jgi:hypothetical protein
LSRALFDPEDLVPDDIIADDGDLDDLMGTDEEMSDETDDGLEEPEDLEGEAEAAELVDEFRVEDDVADSVDGGFEDDEEE